MSEKRNDDKGYERGAKGIDGKEGEGFQNEGIESAAIERMYARAWGVSAGKSKKGLG